MQQFTVPQFIDVEDKIIGPITVRQFIIMMAGFMVIGIFYKIFNFSLFVMTGIGVFGMSGILAFFKVNGMPFHFFVLNFTQTAKRPSLRVWNNSHDQEAQTEDVEKIVGPKIPVQPEKLITTSRLAQLALVVDTQGGYKGEEENAQIKIQSEKRKKVLDQLEIKEDNN